VFPDATVLLLGFDQKKSNSLQFDQKSQQPAVLTRNSQQVLFFFGFCGEIVRVGLEVCIGLVRFGCLGWKSKSVIRV